MSIVEILYIITGVCLVVVTVSIVWLANETIKLVKSLRKSSDDVAFMTQEVREKVLLVTEALDRAGTAASNIIGLIENAIEGIKEKRDQLADSIGLVTGVGEYFKKKRNARKDEEEEEEEIMPKKEKKGKSDEETEETVEVPVKEDRSKKTEVEVNNETDESDNSNQTKKELKEKSA